MKNLWIAVALFVTGVMTAQEKENAKHEVVDQMVKSTYYHENGNVQQQGFYKEGKLHGHWISYDEAGKKVAMGQYEDGKKVGKWFFWTGSELAEVDYNDYRIAQVKKWTNSSVVQNR